LVVVVVGIIKKGKRYDTGMPHPYAETIYTFHKESLRSAVK
jgi:UTP-glucose-1-phosphate uridylyltransferase